MVVTNDAMPRNVFILEWNPEISNVKINNFYDGIDLVKDNYSNWSVWDWEKAKEGDMFFLIKCGQEGPTGIVQQGIFSSDPYSGEDWSGKGRPTHYIDMDVHVHIDFRKAPILTTAELEEAMPDFQWNGGHSGRMLPESLALKLEQMWGEYLDKNQDIFDGDKAQMLMFL